MRHSQPGTGRLALVVRGIRRSPWRSFAGAVAAAVAAAAFLGAAALLVGMDRTLSDHLDRLGADLVVIPPAHRAAVEEWLATGEASPVPARLPVAEWQAKMDAGVVVGVRHAEAWNLTAGGRGEATADPVASALLLYLERWAEPMITVSGIREALPEAEVVVAEQAVRRVAEDLQPVVRLLTVSAGVAWLASLLMAGLLTAAQVAERRGELGMMRAVGASRSFLLSTILGEAGTLAVAGALAGVGLSLGGLALFPPEGLLRLTTLEISGLGAAAAAMTVLTAVAAASGPALRAVRMDPLEALRQGQ